MNKLLKNFNNKFKIIKHQISQMFNNLKMLSLAKYIKKKIELYENLVGTGFLEPP